jgi:hypothetical protein
VLQAVIELRGYLILAAMGSDFSNVNDGETDM